MRHVWSQGAWSLLLKVTIVIENKAGAAGNVGTAFVVSAPSDGCTLLVHGAALATYPHSFKQLPFDPFTDLVSVGSIGVTPTVLATSNKSISNLDDLFAWARIEAGRPKLWQRWHRRAEPSSSRRNGREDQNEACSRAVSRRRWHTPRCSYWPFGFRQLHARIDNAVCCLGRHEGLGSPSAKPNEPRARCCTYIKARISEYKRRKSHDRARSS